ncbi:MAG: 3-deoxy-8-phosphooctulonate synthase [Deltaproteobacteria bacterium]|nr:3-deoxy-8-phosphooctulonate synthase [Deltaproteobacteria bacterium]
MTTSNPVAITPEISIGRDRPLALIAGPCVIENEALALETAAAVAAVCRQLAMPYIFKASYDKANRSSWQSFRGPGLKEGLRILARVREELALPATTDVHSPAEAEEAARVVDLLQIPAFLCRQTDLLLAAGASGKPVNVKKGQFMAPGEMANIRDKIASTGNRQIMFTERGTTFGYHNLVVDFRAVPLMQAIGCPVIFDATHSVQRPAALGTASGGDREMIPTLAAAAVAAGADALFMEVHPEPEKALCDGANSLPLAALPALLARLLRLRAALADADPPAPATSGKDSHAAQ